MSTRTDGRGLTRRGFLKGAGITAAGAAIADSGLLGNLNFSRGDETKSLPVLGPGESTVKLLINGVDTPVQIEPRMTLAEALRVKLDMTGTKIVCDRGACGGCTVWVDGQPVNSCMTLAVDTIGRPITTIEGLAKGDQLHPVQQQFIQHDATQCGFCTPAMIMSCAHLVETNKNPSLAEIKTAVSGNLCRCGTYPKIFAAVQDAAKQM